MRATMPAKMMSEMPLPMPRSVICSPIHMMNAVPAASESMVMSAEAPARVGDDRAGRPWSRRDSRYVAMPKPWRAERTMVP